MKVIAPADVYLAAIGGEVKEGDVVEVDQDTGTSLVEQGWKRAKATAKADATDEET